MRYIFDVNEYCESLSGSVYCIEYDEMSGSPLTAFACPLKANDLPDNSQWYEAQGDVLLELYILVDRGEYKIREEVTVDHFNKLLGVA